MDKRIWKRVSFIFCFGLCLPSCQPFGTATVTNSSYLETVCIQPAGASADAAGRMSVTETTESGEINEYVNVSCNNGKTLQENLQGHTPTRGVATVLPAERSTQLKVQLTPANVAAMRVRNSVARSAFLVAAKAIDAAEDNEATLDSSTCPDGSVGWQIPLKDLAIIFKAFGIETGPSDDYQNNPDAKPITLCPVVATDQNNGVDDPDQKSAVSNSLDKNTLNLDWLGKDPLNNNAAIAFIAACETNTDGNCIKDNSNNCVNPKTQGVFYTSLAEGTKQTNSKGYQFIDIKSINIPCDNGKTLEENLKTADPDSGVTVRFTNPSVDQLTTEAIQTSGTSETILTHNFFFDRNTNSQGNQIDGIKKLTFLLYQKSQCQTSLTNAATQECLRPCTYNNSSTKYVCPTVCIFDLWNDGKLLNESSFPDQCKGYAAIVDPSNGGRIKQEFTPSALTSVNQ